MIFIRKQIWVFVNVYNNMQKVDKSIKNPVFLIIEKGKKSTF